MTVSIEYADIAPMVLVFGAAVIGVLVEAFVPARARTVVHAGVAGCAIVSAFVAVAVRAARGMPAHAILSGSLAADGISLAFQAVLLISALAALALLVARSNPMTHTESVPLMMFALGGMMAFVAAADLLSMFIALEVFSLPLYLLTALAKRRGALPLEAALKYFLLGAFSSAIFLFGIALRFAATGSTGLGSIGGDRALLTVGAALLGVGLLFKIGAVPFHSWVPDVYQAAPTPVTAFMASATKIAAFGALLRLTLIGFDGVPWRPVVAVVAIASLIYGSIAAVTQTDVKRLLAYSAIAHTGFILVGVYPGTLRGVGAVCFYLLVYALSTIAAFAVSGVVRERRSDGALVEVGELERWAGIGRRSPLLAAAMTLLLVSFAGIPVTSGFVGKFAVFAAAGERGGVWLVVVGVLASAVTAAVYLRVIVSMYFAPDPEFAPDAPEVDAPTYIVIGLGVVSVLVLGVYPQPVLDLVTGLSVLGW